MKTLLNVVTTMLLLTGVAHAHSGHGVTKATQILHYIAEPAHILPVMLVVAVVVAIVRTRRASASCRK